jgi:hypothetical protein
MASKLITAKQQMRAAQSFAFFSSIAVILLPAIIPMLLWIAASIFAYCAVACHPNKRVQSYLTIAGYRFYGLVGGLVVALNFSPQMAKAVGGWLNLGVIIWILSILVVVPFGIRDILRAKKEPWQDMQVETE